MESLQGARKEYYTRLRRGIFIAVVIVSFIPLLIFGGAMRYEFQTSYSEKVRAYLETLVIMHSQTIDHFLKERQANLISLSRAYSFDELIDKEFLQKQLSRMQGSYGPMYTDLGVVTENGQQISYAGPFELENANYTDASWFKSAIQSETYLSDVFLGLRRQPHFIVTVRKFQDGKPWVLRATVDFLAFNDLVRGIQIGQTGFAFVLNKSGELQTNTSADISVEASQYARLFNIEAPTAPTSPLNEGGEPPSDDTLFGERMSEAGKKIIYVARLLKNGNWALVFQQDHFDAFQDLYEARRLALITFILGGVAIITMALLVSRKAVSKISKADEEKEIMGRQVVQSGHLASLGMLAAGIAHEINNPVAIMVEEAGWIEDLLKEEEFQEGENLKEFREALKQIKKQGIRCRDITHKLLSFARRSDNRFKAVNLNELIREVADLCSQHAKYSNVAIEMSLDEHLAEVTASQTELEQVLFNLLNNAIDAMDRNGGNIRIRTWQADNSVYFDIKDDGPGIPDEKLERIFDPFFTTKAVGKGSGLGLSICYGIIQKLGGDIMVESMLRKGTRFEIRLPVKETPVDATTAEAN